MAALLPTAVLAVDDGTPGLSVRMRAQFFAVLSEAHEAAGQHARALDALRRCQRLHLSLIHI